MITELHLGGLFKEITLLRSEQKYFDGEICQTAKPFLKTSINNIHRFFYVSITPLSSKLEFPLHIAMLFFYLLVARIILEHYHNVS